MTTLASNPQPAAPAAAAPAKGVQEASPRQVQQWLAAGQAILIDVREPDEHAREQITGSSLLPLSRFDAVKAAGLARPGQRIVMHCKGGVRSADAVRRAAAVYGSGAAVLSMTGGIEAWKKENLPVEVNTQVSVLSIMRQVQLVIGTGVLAGCALAWLVDPLFIGLSAFFGAGLVFAGASGTCALATLLGKMPWNRAAAAAGGTAASCGAGSCG